MTERAALAALAVLLAQACGGESRSVVPNNGKGGEAGAGVPRGGSSSGGTSGSSSGSSGEGGGGGVAGASDGGGTAGRSGAGGAGGTAGEAGASGESGEGTVCAGDGSSCPDGCFPLPIVTGCGDGAERLVLCANTQLVATGLSCGVRLEDGRYFHGDGQHPPNACVPNPFAAVDGFRVCTSAEARTASCGRVEEQASTGTVRFDVTNNRESPIWVVNDGMSCEPLGVTRLPGMQAVRLASSPLSCGCPTGLGGAVDPIYTLGVTRLEPNESLSITWDGRELRTFAFPVPCSAPCEPGDRACSASAMVVSPAGPYRAAVAVDTDPAGPLASAYQSTCGDSAACTLTGGYIAPGGVCTRSDVPNSTVEFELPSGGDIVVLVPID